MERKSNIKTKKLAISMVGLTASGKTSFLHNILDFLIEEGITFSVISVDSGAVYKYLDIGTAKPSREEISRYRYHLVDVVSPCERYSLARFISDVRRVLDNFSDDVLFVVGGTPLYFYTLVGESGYVPVSPDYKLREYLYKMAEERGKEYVYRLMKELDPISAQDIHPNDIKRIVRTLEINLSTGMMRKYATKFFHDFRMQFDEKRYVFLPEPSVLRDNIHIRTRQMFESGFVEEAGKVADICSPPAPWLDVLGYKHALSAFIGEITREEALQDVFLDTWRFARRQRTWFKNDKKGIKIVDKEDRNNAFKQIVSNILAYTGRR